MFYDNMERYDNIIQFFIFDLTFQIDMVKVSDYLNLFQTGILFVIGQRSSSPSKMENTQFEC